MSKEANLPDIRHLPINPSDILTFADLAKFSFLLPPEVVAVVAANIARRIQKITPVAAKDITPHVYNI